MLPKEIEEGLGQPTISEKIQPLISPVEGVIDSFMTVTVDRIMLNIIGPVEDFQNSHDF